MIKRVQITPRKITQKSVPVSPKVSTPVATTATAVMRVPKALEVLTSLLEKAQVIDLRGKSQRPELLLSKGELQALQCAVTTLEHQVVKKAS